MESAKFEANFLKKLQDVSGEQWSSKSDVCPLQIGRNYNNEQNW